MIKKNVLTIYILQFPEESRQLPTPQQRLAKRENIHLIKETSIKQSRHSQQLF